MKNLITASALAFASLALLPTAALADQITVTAPALMNEAQTQQWDRLERRANRLAERIADSESKVADENSELARAQARLVEAQAKVQEEQRELDRALTRLEDRRGELASIEADMIRLGGTRPQVVTIGQR